MENKILATVGQKQITEADLQAFIQNLGANASQFQGPNGRKQLINELIMQELVYLDAIENGFDKNDEFTTVLEEMKRNLLSQYAVSKLLRNVTVTDEEVESYFNQNKEMFKMPPSARASHILVSSKEEAEKIIDEINSGLDFAEAAKKYSSCPSKEVGGDLGEFSKGRMVPEFERAVFSMEVDSISEPVQTPFGYHIIKLLSLSNSDDVKFEEVKAKVKDRCLSEKQAKVYSEKQAELAAKYSVVAAE